jgi:CRP/FNR family transcriptional regulator, cyclic AMP receptor protein
MVAQNGPQNAQSEREVRSAMPCDPDELRHVPLFELLDDEEARVLAAQVEMRRFAPRERIFKTGEPSGHGYVVMSGLVRVTTTDEDQQEVVVQEPSHGEFFGFASMLQQTDHQTTAVAMEETICLEVGRDDIATLLKNKPMAGMDMLTMQARQFHATQQLVRSRAARNANDLIEEQSSFGERVADSVARFGGSWSFIILFLVVLIVYSSINVALGGRAWDPYPFILLNLFLSMLAAIQAPVIMMSQNRQDQKDRVRSELDFDVNRRAESEIQSLSRRMSLLMETMEDVARQTAGLSGKQDDRSAGSAEKN